eukprot:gb/GFBE01073776.1/.p1 GENE.gb/GFBE01073776.1/~~gb/GFBE01073776.1/.p1  ORF type:complete len:123 (+),score=12.75 gb/GFBE01073776.1/:1-369(+)
MEGRKVMLLEADRIHVGERITAPTGDDGYHVRMAAPRSECICPDGSALAPAKASYCLTSEDRLPPAAAWPKAFISFVPKETRTRIEDNDPWRALNDKLGSMRKAAMASAGNGPSIFAQGGTY